MACDFPYYVVNPQFPRFSPNERTPVPCGKCPKCLKDRSDAWSFRLFQQELVSDSSCFITLTYDTKYVPISKNKFLTLDKKAFPVFIRSVRKRLSNRVKLMYYAVGEYGTLRRRPHYHAIVFNLPDIVWSRDLDGQEFGVSRLVNSAWQYGVVDIRRCNSSTIGYTCKYLHKGKTVPMHSNDDRVPEFSLMSKGLGLSYLTSEVVNFYSRNPTSRFVNYDGRKLKLPRYYASKLYVCPVAKLVQYLYVEELIPELQQKAMVDYFHEHGNLDDFFLEQALARSASVKLFKARAVANRKDL